MSESTANQPTWYAMPVAEVAAQLKVDPAKGLSASDAAQRLQQYGPNQLAAKKKESGLQAFLRQYKDFMQILLLGAAIVNQIFTQEVGTTLVLIGLTIFNAVLGRSQESKAEASLAALEKMMKNIARVRRDGQAIEIEAEQLVPGDIVLMEAGNRVPADGRLFVTATLEIEEAALTGESVASSKDETIDKTEVPLGDRHNMAYMNTAVTRGRGEMIVTTTGMGTEMGNIADLLNKTEADKTPLQKQLDRLTIIIAGIAGLTFVVLIHPGSAPGQEFRRHLPGWHCAGDLGHSHRPARGGDHHLLDGHARAGGAERHRQAAALRGDAGFRFGDLLRQDRHVDAQQDDGGRVLHPRPEPLQA
jgi:Ca2+-transporting ATPase